MNIYNIHLLKLPIKIGIAFSLFTLFLFLYGPYNYGRENYIFFIVFMISCYYMMYKGFLRGISKPLKTCIKKRTFPIIKILNIMYIISLVISIPRFMIFTHIFSFDPSLLLSRFIMFFTDASSLYTEKLLFENVTGVWIYINYIIILLSPIYWIYTILSMLLWRNLNNLKKIGSLFIYLLWILQYICTATNVGLFNFFIIFVICYISRDFLESKESKINYKKYVFYLGCLAVLLCVIFSITMGSRIGDNYDASYSYITNRNVNIDQNSILWICTPNVLKPLLCYFTRYLAIPYQALMLSFNLEWTPTWGIGHSWFFLDQFPYSKQLWDMTYNMKLDYLYDYDYYGNWHTPFIWFANDVSFLGVPVLLYFLFAFFGRSWKNFLLNKNLPSFLIFILFVNMICFISANNQVFQNSDTCLVFYFLLFFNKKLGSFNWSNCYVRK